MRSQRGAALVVTLVLLLGLAAMALMTATLGGTDLIIAGNDRRYQASLDIAEAGVAEALHRLSMRPGETVTVNGNTYDASIRDASDPPDQDWMTRIFLTPEGSQPAGSGSVFSTGTIQSSGSYLEYGHASDPTQAIRIEHRKADLDNDGDEEIVFYDPTRIPAENATTGQPIERITVQGTWNGAKRSVLVDAIRFPINPNVTAALLTDGEVDLRGNVSVCGHDHRANTPTGTQLSACSPAWDTASGHLYAVMTTGDDVSTQGSTDMLGTPTATNTDAANFFQTVWQTLGVTMEEWQTILDDADYTSFSADPQVGITHITGNASVNGITGEGLLYVDGDLDIGGNFVWRGLVYVEGTLENNGNTWILGGVVVRGDGTLSVDFGAGTPAILYSSEMLVQALTSAMDYVVLNWKEL